MSEQMEKLIEETTQQALWIAHDPQVAGFRTKELITRIGKAYADGELELPGEKGRTSFGEKDWMTAIYGWFVDLWRRWQGGRGTIIALSTETREGDG